jgi:hypothetical protein
MILVIGKDFPGFPMDLKFIFPVPVVKFHIVLGDPVIDLMVDIFNDMINRVFDRFEDILLKQLKNDHTGQKPYDKASDP